MAQSSYSGRVMRIPAASFAADEPVSATRAFLLRNNLLHLLDEFCQHRINWCAGKVDNNIGGSGCFASFGTLDNPASHPYALYEAEFPHFWLNPGHPGNLDLLIRSSIVVGGGSPSMDVRVRVVPAYYAAGDLGSAALIDETHSVTDASGSWSHQEFFDTDDASQMSLLRSARERAFEIVEDGEWHYPEVALLKLQVHLQYVSGDSNVIIVLTGVSVREFA